MALASIPASSTDGSTSPLDAYLLEVYRQAAESARPSADTRFSSLGAFLTFVGLLTAALAVLFSVPEGPSSQFIPAASMALGVIGLLVSIVFYALEVRRHQAFAVESQTSGSTCATASIYQASIGFFGFAIIIAAALLLLR
jgi:hypothetical protein